MVGDSLRGHLTGVLSIIGLVILGAAGCGRTPYKVVPISGTIKYEDGSRIEADMVSIVLVSQEAPLDRKTHPRVGRAELNIADGTFRCISTYDFDDGAIVGRHKIVLRALGPNEASSDAIPEAYSDVSTTPLEIEVGAQRHFDLRIGMREPEVDEC